MTSADTNLFLYAANPNSPLHATATAFFKTMDSADFVICELVLVEIYMQLRNPAVLPQPLSASQSAAFCKQLREHPRWQHVDYEPAVSASLWKWAADTTVGFRQIIDARLALTLQFHGVTEFATANLKHFETFGFERLWNPLAE